MEENKAHKFYLCKFCNQIFSDGMKYGGHIRGHMALFSGSIKQSTIEHDQETNNCELGELGLVFDEKIFKRGAEKLGLDEDNEANFYTLRENPNKSWRVSVSNSNSICKQCGKGFNSMTGLETHRRFHFLKSKESVKKNLCTKFGKGFDSWKALYGHMRWHKIKKYQPPKKSTSSSSSVSSSSEEDGKLDEGVKREIFSPIRRKRSCPMYKPANPNIPSSSTSLSPFASTDEFIDDEMEEAALCLMLLSRGLEDFGGGKMVISAHQEVGVCIDGSMMCFKKKVIGECGSSHANINIVNGDLRSNGQPVLVKGKGKVYEDQCDSDLRKSKKYKCSVDGSIMRFKKEDICESGSGQNAMDIVSNHLRSNGQNVRNKGKRKVYDDQCDTNIRKSKAYKCSICFKEFGSGQALGGHMRAHYNVITSNETDSKQETVDDFNIHERMERMDLEGGIKNDMAQQ